jgi:hypothetical protein
MMIGRAALDVRPTGLGGVGIAGRLGATATGKLRYRLIGKSTTRPAIL